jgi:hypothetical protein
VLRLEIRPHDAPRRSDLGPIEAEGVEEEPIDGEQLYFG